MDESDIRWRPAPGVETDPIYEDLFLVELELKARHPDLKLYVVGLRHYGMGHGELAHVAVEIAGPCDPASAEASARRKALRREAKEILGAIGYTVAVQPSWDVYDLAPAREELSAHERMRRLREFRVRLTEEYLVKVRSCDSLKSAYLSMK